MIDPAHVPPVADDEDTGRFVFTRGHINRLSGTRKANAFLPHPHDELSVQRLIQSTESEVWETGASIGSARNPPRTAYGRGDVLVNTYRQQRLVVFADPVEGNANHTVVRGWPKEDKDAQLLHAKEIAAVARFVSVPNGASPHADD